MEFLFIKKIIDKKLFDNSSDIIIDEIFNYYDNKEKLIDFNNLLNKDESNDYEFIIDVDTTPLNENETEEMNIYISAIKEEINRIQKVVEYLIANVDINKIKLLNYKIYNYDNTSKFIKSKVKNNNHNFDLKKFILKNKIDKNEIIEKMKKMTIKDVGQQVSENKLMIYFLLIKIIDFYNYYNKCLTYSLKLLEEYPYIYKNKNDYLIEITNKYMNVTNDEINFYHYNLIKNAYVSTNKLGDTINLKRGSDKNFEISFK